MGIATYERHDMPPVFSNAAAAEQAADSLRLRRDAALNRRHFDRSTGFDESRDECRQQYVEQLRNAGLDNQADALMNNWQRELE